MSAVSGPKLTRRRFNALLATGAVALAGAPYVHAAAPKVVVVGGGFGGATAARYLKRFDPGIDVTLVVAERNFVTCPFSNTVIGGLNSIEHITHGFEALGREGIRVVHSVARAVDPKARKVHLRDGATLPFDRAVVSPGIGFRWDDMEGYGPEVSTRIPHAWQAGEQTLLLRRQLEAMPDGGVFIISPPVNPFRCPPGPGERISLVAHYFKRHKPRAKILVLDPKQKFSKQALFEEGWAKLYPGMIEYRGLADDGVVRRVDAKAMTLHTDFGEERGDVINLIPPQRAGDLAAVSGLTDETGWCPVEQLTFESTRAPGVHVIGDAAIAAPMPKSGFAASTQAKVVAASVSALLRDRAPVEPKFVNTCYSLVAPDYGITVAMVYAYRDGKIVEIDGSGGLSPLGATDQVRRLEADYADGWYRSISSDIWG